jgi:hypothetical protein
MHLVPISTLEESAAEYTTALPPIRLELLADIYKVASQDAELRRQSKGAPRHSPQRTTHGRTGQFQSFEALVAPALVRSHSAEMAKSSSTEGPKSPVGPKSPAGVTSPSLDMVASTLGRSIRKRTRDESQFETPADLLAQSVSKRVALNKHSSYQPLCRSLAMSGPPADVPRSMAILPAKAQPQHPPPQQHQPQQQPLFTYDFSASQFVPQLDDHPFSFMSAAPQYTSSFVHPVITGYDEYMDATLACAVPAYDWSMCQ